MANPLCPRCNQTLTQTGLGHLCPGCEGCWLDYEQLNHLLRLSDSQLESSELVPTVEDSHSEAARERYLRCPLCGGRMRRQIYLADSGVVVDMCREHGIWLDDGELGKMRRYLHQAESPQEESPPDA